MKNSNQTVRQLLLLGGVASISTWMTCSTALAASDTWTGGGAADGNWTNAANWTGGNTPPLANDFLFFDGSAQLLSTNNFTAGTVFDNLTFNSTASSFNLAGNPLTLAARTQDSSGNMTGGGITNLSPNVQTVGFPLTFTDGLHYIINGAAGQLNLNGTITRNVDATADFNTSAGVINTSGSSLTNDSSANSGITGGWAVINTGNNVGDWATVNGSANVVAYSGYTAFGGGTSFGGTQTGKNVKINSRSSTASSLNGSTAGTYDMNTLLWNIGNSNPGGNQTLNVGSGQILRLGTNGGIMNVHGNSRTFVVGSSSSGIITAGGPNNNTPGELTLVQLNANGGQLQINATLADNGASGAVTVNEVGSVNYNFANTYSGGTHLHFGEAFLQSGARFGSGPIYVYPGARADFGSQNAATITNNFFIAGFGFVQANQPGTIKGLFNGTFTGTFTLMDNAAIDPNAGSSPNTCTFTGPFTGTGSLSIGSSISPSGYVEGTATFGGNCNFTGDMIADASPNNNGGAGIKIASGANNIINNGGNVNLIGGSTGIASFDLNGTTQTINGLGSPSGQPANAFVKSSSGNGVLTIGNNNVSSVFGGNLQNGGGTLAVTKIGMGTVTLNGANSYTGTTTVSNGVLSIGNSLASAQILVASGALLDISALGTFTLGSGQTLGGNGAVNGSISTASGSVISPGFSPGTLTLSNDLTLNTGATCFMELSTTTNGANDQIRIGGNLNLNGAAIQISAGALQPGRYRLIVYAGTESGAAANNLVLSYSGAQSVALDDSIPGEIDLLVSSAFITQLTWKGDNSLNVWDINTTPNWLNGVTPSVFTNNTAVTFNDSGSKVPDVNISTTVQPASLLVSNNTGTYTFSGSGNITGGTGVTKKGAGTLVLNDTGGDNFSGGILVQSGSLLMSNSSVNISGGLTVANGSALLANNGSMTGNVIVQGGSLLLDQAATVTGNLVVSNGASAQLGNNDGSGTLPSGSLTVNGTLDFNNVNDITVPNAISGTGTLNKNTNDLVALTGTSGFAGNINIASGTLQSPAAAGLGSVASGIIAIANGATLDKGVDEVKPIVAVGFGVSSNGAIVNTSGAQIYDGNGGLTSSLTLEGDTMMGGNTRLDLGGINGATLNTGGSNYNMTMNNSAYMEWEKLTIDTNFGNIDVLQGTFGIKGSGSGIGNPTNTILVHAGAELQFWGDTTNNSGYAKNIHVLSNGIVSFRPQNPNVYYTSALSFDDGANWNMFNGSGSIGTVFLGPVTLNGLVHVQMGDSTCAVSNVIGGPGGFFWDNFNNTLALAATNTYQGVTDIRAGRTLALVGSGSILQSSNILLAVGATLNAAGRTDHTLTLASPQALVTGTNGSATVTGNLTASAGSLVLPGGSNTIGTLAVSSNVVLQGTLAMDIDILGATNDMLVGGTNGNISYGGTLNVTNLTGSFTAGQSFKLFDAGTYGNSFAAIVPSTPGTGLTWNTSSLAVNGTLNVVTVVSTPPTISSISVSGGNVIITGTNNVGAGGTYHVLTSTNLTIPLTNWTVLTNGTFDGNGEFSSTNAAGSTAEQFYILQVP